MTIFRIASRLAAGLGDFHGLHVWLWKPSPSGMFYEWNPRVACP